MARRVTIRAGDFVKITQVSNNAPHLLVGSVHQVSGVTGQYVHLDNNSVYTFKNCVTLTSLEFNKTNLSREHVRLEEELEEVKNKMAFLEETQQSEATEEEYKVYQTMTTIEDKKLSKKEKAKIIAKMVARN